MKNYILQKIPVHILRAILLFSSRSLHSLSSLIFSFIVGRILTIEDHGLYSQYLARMIILQALLEVGLQYSIIKYLTPFVIKENKEQIRTILRASLYLKILAIIYTFFIVLSWILFNFISNKYAIQFFIFPTVESPDQITQVWLIFLSAIGMSFFSYFDTILVSQKKYKALIIWIPITGISRILLLLFFFFINEGNLQINHVFFSFMGGTFLAWPFYFFYFDSDYYFGKISVKKIKLWIRKLVSYNYWILLASFFAILSDWMELLMIQNQTSAGIFNAARIPMQGILILLSTMQSLIMPAMSNFKTAIEYKIYFIKIYKYILLLILILLPAGFIGNWFIPRWFGEDYYESVYVFWILYPGFLLRLLFAPLGSALFILNQPILIALEAGLRMLGSFVLNSSLIPVLGIKGAAIASVFSQFFGWFFLMGVFYYFFKKGYLPDIYKILNRIINKKL